jgi:hypothetical protein
VRIVNTRDTEFFVGLKYMTISHCWGDIRMFKLTIESFGPLSSGIDASLLPKTFQDSIKVALFLSISSLWIDSLWIFQNSSEDWAQESSAMGAVYYNAACNITAGAAKNGNISLLRERIEIPKAFYVRSSW